MTHSQPPGGTPGQEALRAEYGEVCSNFRTLTEIRFKLLAFLPLAAGVTTAFTGGSTAERFLISLFGLAATAGLATYNSRNDQLYDELVGRAAEIERRLGLPDGAFANRPGPWRTIRFGGPLSHRIDHRTGVFIIYAASFALWLYGIIAPLLALLHRLAPLEIRQVWPAAWLQPVALALALIVILVASSMIEAQRKARKSEMTDAAESAVRAAEARPPSELADDDDFLRDCILLSGAKEKTITARLGFFAGLDPDQLRFYIPDCSPREEASFLVALLTDLPPRWIDDCATNRRGAR